MKRRKKLKYTRENRGTLYAIAKEALEWQLDMLSRAAKEMLSDLFPRVPLSKQHRVFEFVKGIRWPYSRDRYDLVAVGLGKKSLHNTSKVAELILHCCDTPDDVMNALKQIGDAIIWCQQCYRERLREAEKIAKEQSDAIRYIESLTQ